MKPSLFTLKILKKKLHQQKYEAPAPLICTFEFPPYPCFLVVHPTFSKYVIPCYDPVIGQKVTLLPTYAQILILDTFLCGSFTNLGYSLFIIGFPMKHNHFWIIRLPDFRHKTPFFGWFVTITPSLSNHYPIIIPVFPDDYPMLFHKYPICSTTNYSIILPRFFDFPMKFTWPVSPGVLRVLIVVQVALTSWLCFRGWGGGWNNVLSPAFLGLFFD